MEQHYPLSFTLENGTHVEVTKTDSNSYSFLLTTLHGATETFTYTEDDRPKDEIEAHLDFNRLDALRKFWLKKTNIL